MFPQQCHRPNRLYSTIDSMRPRPASGIRSISPALAPLYGTAPFYHHFDCKWPPFVTPPMIGFQQNSHVKYR
ncbi:hypothetical protein N431DRAFT_100534 [Stipitochalara longipes BDJ]|nr:hypothetical protein N431DRAFT_100534 [Stipitochalara longipes BDJ]